MTPGRRSWVSPPLLMAADAISSRPATPAGARRREFGVQDPCRIGAVTSWSLRSGPRAGSSEQRSASGIPTSRLCLSCSGTPTLRTHALRPDCATLTAWRGRSGITWRCSTAAVPVGAPPSSSKSGLISSPIRHDCPSLPKMHSPACTPSLCYLREVHHPPPGQSSRSERMSARACTLLFWMACSSTTAPSSSKSVAAMT